ncbi:MAG: redox-regulated ATPase YchF [Deltaproteobacteria bacterium]|nr:redox-regulated ATPase YchF [Deltaproteobacteria bacterium]
MTLNCGIVGLPNVGKSTIFNALTSAKAAAANYPFCTIEPNTGVVPVRDPRLEAIAAIFRPERIVPTTVEFVDIAGLVKDASKGAGLGNQFLGHIREVDAIVQVVRCFADPDVVHVHGKIDPLYDVEVINAELLLADLEAVEKRLERVGKAARLGQKEGAAEAAYLETLRQAIAAGTPARRVPTPDDMRPILKDLRLLTAKPALYVANVSEDGLRIVPPEAAALEALAAREGSQVVRICGAIEAEIAELEPADRAAFLTELGQTASGLDRLTHAAYQLLHFATFFTAGPKEARAWTIRHGTSAPEAAGAIHSDFERGFIRAEVYHYDDLIACGSEAGVRAKGLLRSEGKEYVVRDGDIIFFRFNV